MFNQQSKIYSKLWNIEIKKPLSQIAKWLFYNGGADGTRTRDPRRDRPEPKAQHRSVSHLFYIPKRAAIHRNKWGLYKLVFQSFAVAKALVIYSVFSTAQADCQHKATAVHLGSAHFSQSNVKTNDINLGVGIAMDCGKHSIEFGAYRNSGVNDNMLDSVETYSDISAYISIDAKPFFYGVATGYNSSILPVIGLKFEYEHINVRVLPGMFNNSPIFAVGFSVLF